MLLVPTTWMVKVPRGVDPPVRTVSVDERPAATGLELKLAVVDEGRPLAESETEPAKPFFADMVTVKGVLEPLMTVREAGVSVSAKSGGCDTVRLTEAE